MSNFSDGQIRQWREFHPRAVKLLSRHKPFLVVANDEPYYHQVYAMIREHEIEVGRWSEIDERNYQAAQQTRAAVAPMQTCPICFGEKYIPHGNGELFQRCPACNRASR